MPRVGDGTGQGSVPEGQGLTANQDKQPENPSAPWNSNRGGRGPEVMPAASSPQKGKTGSGVAD